MAAAVAGEVLGPRPGMAIVSFWQGRVEIVARTVAILVGSLPALVAAAVAIGTANLSSEINAAIDVGSGAGNGTATTAAEIGDLRQSTFGAAGWVVAIAGVGIIEELLKIILRFCNIGLVNLKIKIFLIESFCVDVVLILGHLAGGIVVSVYASEWGDFSGVSNMVERVQAALISAAVFCFIGVFLYIFVAIWEIVFLAKDWNNKVVKYTLKEAITG